MTAQSCKRSATFCALILLGAILAATDAQGRAPPGAPAQAAGTPVQPPPAVAAHPGTEAALRRSIAEVRAGNPDYTQMSADFAALVRQQLPRMQSLFKSWGELKSVKFTGVGPLGWDAYDVVFDNATASFAIGLTADGKIAGEGVRPAGAQAPPSVAPEGAPKAQPGPHAVTAEPAPVYPHITYVTNDPSGADYGPQFSPDSQRLIFERAPLVGGRAETYWVPIQGGTPQVFLKETSPVGQTRLRWSPLTNRIAFTGIGPQGTTSTWLMEPDGTHIHQASAPGGPNVFYPSWYPDGSKVLEMDGDNLAPRILNLSTGSSVQLHTTPALLTGMGSVSPDGKWIAIAAQRNLGQRYDQSKNEIWLLSEQGDAHPLEKGDMQGRAPTWSPDGSKVVFESDRNGGYAIFVADRDGTNVQQLTPSSALAEHPVWSPDGKWLAFSVREVGGFRTTIAMIPAPPLTP